MRVALLAIVLAAACGGKATKSPIAVPADASPSPKTAPRFLLPALELDSELTLAVNQVDGKRPARWKGKLVIDGQLTDATWPEQTPRAYRVDGDRWLLHDPYNDYSLYIWERGRARLTKLGRGRLLPVPGMGYLVAPFVEKGKPIGFSMIAPLRPQLRPIWTADDPTVQPRIIGVHDAAIVIELRRIGPGGGRADVSTLLFVKPDETIEQDIALRGWYVEGGDAIRDGRIALLGPRHPTRAQGGSPWDKPISQALGLYELATGRIRELGRATGAWTQYTAIPHDYVHVRWTTEAELATQPANLGQDSCITYIVESTEQIRTNGCRTSRQATNVGP